METSAVGIHAPVEPDVGAVVVRENLPRVVFVDFQLRGRDVVEVLDLRRKPWIGRVGDDTQRGHAAKRAPVRVFSQASGCDLCRPVTERRSSQGGPPMKSVATAQWEGDLMSGKGKTSAAGGAFRDANLSWKARTEGAAGRTTPEELLAAAHASCFSMALSHALAQGGHPAKRLETSCMVEFGPKKEGGFEVRSSALEVKGWVPGIDDAAFEKAAEGAKSGCPIS